MQQGDKSRDRDSIEDRGKDRGRDRGREDRIIKSKKQYSREISTHHTHKTV